LQTPELAQDALASAQLKAAAGLALLDAKKYKLAARKFAEVSPDMGQQYNSVIAAQDVAVYGVRRVAWGQRLAC
jgi:COP9 signalosome complex subunit 1